MKHAVLKPIALAALFGALVASLIAWPIGGEAVRAALIAQLDDATGLRSRVDGAITLKLLPRPRVRIRELSAASADGSVAIDVPALTGDVDPIALLSGRWRLASATLMGPTFALDLDRAANTWRAAPRGSAASAGFRLSIRSAIVRTISRRRSADTLVTDVEGTAEQAAANGDLTFSGSANWHRVPARLRVRTGPLLALLRGDSSPTTFQVDSPVLTAGGSGTLTIGSQPRFSGHLSASTASWPALQSAIFANSPSVDVRHASIATDVTIQPDDLSLAQLEVKLDQTAIEGSLACHRPDGRWHWEGTLATGSLDFDRLRAEFGRAIDGESWSHRVLGLRKFDSTLDLRVSAGALKVGSVEFADAALSALVEDDRVEVTIDETRAYGGVLKSRATALIGNDGVNARVDTSIAGLDLGPLSTALYGSEHVSGTFEGHLLLEGRGLSLADAARHLSGTGSASVRQGNLTGISIPQTLRRFTRRLPVEARLPGRLTTFDSADAALSVENGVLTIGQGRVVGPGMTMAFGGRTDSWDGSVDIRAVAARTDPEGTLVRGAPRFPFELKGTWAGPLAMTEAPQHDPAFPAFALPDLGRDGLLP